MSKHIDEIEFLDNILLDLHIAAVINKIIISYILQKREQFKTIMFTSMPVLNMKMENDELLVSSETHYEYLLQKNGKVVLCNTKYSVPKYISTNDSNLSAVKFAYKNVLSHVFALIPILHNKHIFFSVYNIHTYSHFIHAINLTTFDYDFITDSKHYYRISGVCTDIYKDMLIIIDDRKNNVSLYNYTVNSSNKIVCTEQVMTRNLRQMHYACGYDEEIYVLAHNGYMTPSIFVLDCNTLLEKRRILFSENCKFLSTFVKSMIVNENYMYVRTQDNILILKRKDVFTEEKITFINIKPSTLKKIKRKLIF